MQKISGHFLRKKQKIAKNCYWPNSSIFWCFFGLCTLENTEIPFVLDMYWLEYHKILDIFFCNQTRPKLPKIFYENWYCFLIVIVCNISLVSFYVKKFFIWMLFSSKIRLYLAKISEKSWFSFIAFFLHPFFAKDFLLWHFLHDAKNAKNVQL